MGRRKKESATLSAAFHACEFALALGVIAAALWAMMSTPASLCLTIYQAPMLVGGGLLLLAALVGLQGVACGHGGLKCLHVFLAILALLALLAFSIFAFVVTAGGAASSSRGQTVYEPAGFSAWMQQQLGSWSSLQACLANTVHVCSDLRMYTRDKLQGKQISPLEAGCCLPPEGCPVNLPQNTIYSFAFAVPTTPTVTTPTNPTSPSACNAFSIDPSILCYSCSLCQGGLLALLQSNLKVQAYVSTAAAGMLLLLGLAMCCAACNGAEPEGLSESDGIALARAPTFVMVEPSLERTLAAGGGGDGARFERSLSRKGGEKGPQNGPGSASFQRSLTFQSMASAEYKRQMSMAGGNGNGNGNVGYAGGGREEEWEVQDVEDRYEDEGVFAFVVTTGGAAEKSRGQTVYAPTTFSSWMQQQVWNDATWGTLQTCLKNIHTCGDLRDYTPAYLQGKQLSPLEAGCCMPPENCFVNSSLPTFFSFAFDLPTDNAPPITNNPPASAAPPRDPRNCSAFSLESNQLCYSCEYCKGGVLQQLKSDLLVEAYFGVGVASAMLLVAMVMCCTQLGRGGRGDDKRRLLDDRGVSMSRTASFQGGPNLNRVNTYQSQGGPQFNRVNTYQSQGTPDLNRVNTYRATVGSRIFSGRTLTRVAGMGSAARCPSRGSAR
ncbi:unnamed protein product [Closterium sp. Yama58-4]|nr:unnamed protein product [Closterium sp. Yama58-4]